MGEEGAAFRARWLTFDLSALPFHRGASVATLVRQQSSDGRGDRAVHRAVHLAHVGAERRLARDGRGTSWSAKRLSRRFPMA